MLLSKKSNPDFCPASAARLADAFRTGAQWRQHFLLRPGRHPPQQEVRHRGGGWPELALQHQLQRGVPEAGCPCIRAQSAGRWGETDRKLIHRNCFYDAANPRMPLRSSMFMSFLQEVSNCPGLPYSQWARPGRTGCKVSCAESSMLVE